MNLNIEIGYEQLLYMVQQLPPVQKNKLVEAIQTSEPTLTSEQSNGLQRFLLTGPVWSEEQQRVLKTRAHFNQTVVEEPTADYAPMELEDAANFLLEEYLHDEELTAFTALDAEDFYETR